MANVQSKLLDVLERHQASRPESTERDRYLDAVERLYAHVRRWLAEAERKDLARVRDGGGIPIHEHGSGDYYAPMLLVDVGRSRIRFVPRGAGAEPGARGRIDLDIDKADRIALLVLDDDGVWHWARRTPPQRFALDEKTFAEAVDQLLGS